MGSPGAQVVDFFDVRGQSQELAAHTKPILTWQKLTYAVKSLICSVQT
jgi:hypothetical protein